jgi:hypothetical protein
MTATARPPSPSRARPWFSRHPIATLIAVNLAIFSVATVLIEAAYRGQWIDFHRTDLVASNPAEALEPSSRPTILALGDSFTAGRDNWPGHLQSLLGSAVRVVNSGVGGSSIRQTRAMVEGRIRRFRPQWVVCQIYAGNDLSDLRHPSESGAVGPLRRLYWRVSDGGMLSPWFFNTRLRLAADRLAPVYRLPPAERNRIIQEMEARPFSVEEYSPRSRALLVADPTLISDQIAVTGEMAAAWSEYRKILVELIQSCACHGVPLTLVVVPHCTQVNPVYVERFRLLGARFPDPTLLEIDEVPFVVQLRETAAGHPGVDVLNALPELRNAEAAGERLYYPNDPHLNRGGRQLLARIIMNDWKSR